MFLNSQPDGNGLSLAHMLFNHPIHNNSPSVKPQPKPYTTETEVEPEIQNQLPTLKPGDTAKIRTIKQETCGKKGSVIAPNDCLRSCNILNEKGNLIIRNRRYLIQTNEKFSVK